MHLTEISAPAKLNLTLDVLGKREDGYHNLKMVMQSVGLCDTLTLKAAEGKGVSVRTNLKFLPNDRRNLAAAAALHFYEATGTDPRGLHIGIHKKIPVCSGMGGGSSDAAAVLRALNVMTGAGLTDRQLAQIGSKVGSDVPYCVLGGTALAEGRGELLTPLPPMPDCLFVICKPGFSVSTPRLFSYIDCAKIRCRPDTAGVLAALRAGDVGAVGRRLYNVFEDVLPSRMAAEVRRIKSLLIEYGALGAVMSGTGPAVYGIFNDPARAGAAKEQLERIYNEVFLTKPV